MLTMFIIPISVVVGYIDYSMFGAVSIISNAFLFLSIIIGTKGYVNGIKRDLEKLKEEQGTSHQ